MTTASPLRLHVGPETLPRGPHGIPSREVAAAQRSRILQAMVDVVAERGYAAMTVAPVIARARVSRRTFYEQFTDREDCFHHAYVCASRMHFEQVRAAARAEPGPWREAIRTGVRTNLTLLAAAPEIAHSLIVDVTAAGERVLADRRRLHDRFVGLLAELAGVPSPGPHDDLILGTVAGANELAARALADGRAAELPALEDAIVALHLAVLEPAAGA